MKKVDYEILAAAINKHLTNSRMLIPMVGDTAQAQEERLIEGVTAVAHTFARFASVDKTAFLKACGIDK